MDKFLSQASNRLFWFGAIYVGLVSILTIPVAQRHALYAHSIKWPLWAKFDHPERYGSAPGKTVNLVLTTTDNIKLGAWFVYADSYYRDILPPFWKEPGIFNEASVKDSIQRKKTIIYFHGNAATRAAPHRVSFYSHWSSRLDVNILAIDYRGFADSDGIPSEEGLALDARAAWDWLIAHGASPENVLLMGQSLGTAVTAKLVSELSSEGVCPRGAILSGAFTDMATLLETYNISGWIPLLQPFQLIPGFTKFVDFILQHKYNTLSILPSVSCPVLLIHAEDDFDIQIFHSQHLFDAMLEPLLESYPFTKQELSQITMKTKEQQELFNEVSVKRRTQAASFVSKEGLTGLGNLFTFRRGDGKGAVHFLRSQYGGHNQIINFEGVMDVARNVFNL